MAVGLRRVSTPHPVCCTLYDVSVRRIDSLSNASSSKQVTLQCLAFDYELAAICRSQDFHLLAHGHAGRKSNPSLLRTCGRGGGVVLICKGRRRQHAAAHKREADEDREQLVEPSSPHCSSASHVSISFRYYDARYVRPAASSASVNVVAVSGLVGDANARPGTKSAAANAAAATDAKCFLFMLCPFFRAVFHNGLFLLRRRTPIRPPFLQHVRYHLRSRNHCVQSTS